jgi:hypothetical protein
MRTRTTPAALVPSENRAASVTVAFVVTIGALGSPIKICAGAFSSVLGKSTP